VPGLKICPRKSLLQPASLLIGYETKARFGRRLTAAMLADERQEKGAVKKDKTLLKLTYLSCCARGEVQKYGIADHIEAVH